MRKAVSYQLSAVSKSLVLQMSSIINNLEEYRANGECSWELPPYGHPLAQGIYPLFANADERLFPLGTAFCFSKLGIVATAEHNIRDALLHHWRGDTLRSMDKLPESYKLSDVGLTILNHYLEDNSYTGHLWPIENFQGAPPTDLVFGFPNFQTHFPFLSLPISFAVPRIGSRVFCVGYSDTCLSDSGIQRDDLRFGRSNWFEAYRYIFRVTRGTVTRIFTQRFSGSFIKGPCFTIDAEVKHGMSGGPVFNEEGYICGVVSAGATHFFNSPASIVSLLYPTLLTDIKLGVSIGPLRINGIRQLVSLIGQGFVITDGSESLVTIRPMNGEIFIGPMIRREDVSFVHDDFSGYQEGREASRQAKEIYRVFKKESS